MTQIRIALVALALLLVACSVPQPIVAMIDLVELSAGTSGQVQPLENDTNSGTAQLLAALVFPDQLFAEVLADNVISIEVRSEATPADYPISYAFSDRGREVQGTVIVRVLDSGQVGDVSDEDNSDVAGIDTTIARDEAEQDEFNTNDDTGTAETATTTPAREPTTEDPTEEPDETEQDKPPPDTRTATTVPPPAATFSVNPPSFQLTKNGPVQEVAIRNEGDTTISPTMLLFDTDDVDISEDACTGVVLAPGTGESTGQSCSFFVGVSSLAQGLFDTTLEVFVEELTSPQLLGISIDAREPGQLVADTTFVNLFDDNETAEVTLSNPGGINLDTPVALNISEVAQWRGELTMSPGTCSDGIPARGTCNVVITMSDYPDVDPLPSPFNLLIAADDLTTTVRIHFYPFIR